MIRNCLLSRCDEPDMLYSQEPQRSVYETYVSSGSAANAAETAIAGRDNKRFLRAAVIGDPISHSLSPIIHNFFLKKYGIDGSYEAIRVAKNELHESVKKLVYQGFAGFNVTIPHKEEIFKICNHKSKTAELTGAVNTVIITPEKKTIRT